MTQPADYVLVANTEAATAHRIAQLIGELRPGLEVRCLNDDAAILLQLVARPPLLLIVDAELPGRGGIELLRQLRSQGSELPFILTSRHIDAASVRAVVPLNPAAYMLQPLDWAKLNLRLDRLLPRPASDLPALPDSVDEFLTQQREQSEGSPLLADVSQAVSGFLRARERDLGQLARELSREPQVTARLITAANSASSHREQPCQSLPQALQRLGLARTLNLVLALSLERFARLSDAELAASAQRLWATAQRCSELANWLARRLGLDAPLCQAAGLLHNIGELAVLRCLQAWVDQRGPLEEPLEALLEKHSAGFGSSLRIRWRLPLGLREPIAAFYYLANGVYSREALVLALCAELMNLPEGTAPASLAESRTGRLLCIQPMVLDALPPALLGRD